MPSGRVTLIRYEELFHELFNEREPERSQVLSDLTGWLERQLGRNSAG
jgi:alpha-beta hydrolase superfamily lysophospholipase